MSLSQSLKRLAVFGALITCVQCDAAVSQLQQQKTTTKTYPPAQDAGNLYSPPQPTDDCTCPDVSDMKMRLGEAEAAVRQAEIELTLTNNPQIIYTSARKARFDRALLGAINDADSSPEFAGKANPFNPFGDSPVAAETNPQTCEISVPMKSRCMTADSKVHETVHMQACLARPNREPNRSPTK